MQVSAGKRLGPYEIVGPVGAGGMGEVWKARDPRIGRDVAIKLLSPSFAQDSDRLRRFHDEACAAGSLAHPNLITIHELDAADGVPYIAMELLEGETLREKLERGPVPPRKAIDYAIQIARGLSAAHEKGIIHRDLKPENLFVTRDGQVKILDFGLARLRLAMQSGSEQSATQVRPTSPGVVMGTAGYMSPEQVRGLDVDERTDIFALGTILYEMLAGRRAFAAASTVETMNAILKDDPPPLDGEIPGALERIIFRCLEKEREQRFGSAHDLAFALDALSGTRSGPQPHAPRQWTTSLRWIAAVAIVAAVAPVAWLAGRATRRSPGFTRNLTQLTFNYEEQPSIAPDAKSFAFVSKAAGENDIYVQRIGGSNAINLTKDSGADNIEPAFSPDGQQIAFHSTREGGGLFVMGATGESVRRVSEVGFTPAWSPDGKSLVVSSMDFQDPAVRSGTGVLYVIDVATAQRRVVRTGDAVEPAWSPDGRWIAYWGAPFGRRVIFMVPAAGGASSMIVGNDSLNWAPAWSPDSHQLYYSSDVSGSMNLWRVAIDRNGRPAGAPEQVTASPGWTARSSIARDGTMVFATLAGDSRLMSLPFDPVAMQVSGSPAPAGNGSRRILTADVTNDGKWIAFSAVGPQENLFVCRPDGSDLRQLTNDSFKNRGPVWSPDGSRIAFFTNRGGDYDIWTIRSDGSDAQQITSGGFRFCHWTPDGRHLIAWKDGHNFATVDASPNGKLVWCATPPSDMHAAPPAAFSPDGKRLVMHDARDRGLLIYDVNAKSWSRIPDLQGNPNWWDDSSLLVLQRGVLVHLDLVTGARKMCGTVPVGPNRMMCRLTSDHRTIYFISRPAESNIWMLRMTSNARTSGGSSAREAMASCIDS
ncbi:MAG TPA: protein kinase, partial [Thermoanaerobaculia bacterium]|nr:protein kinase [Thermoanaerobaculia bacterium]